ncbi:MAG TPA: sulfurtransferase [Acidobacteriota bacterium]|nr:sulfurtransferase [Acidobacteriota bacterium]
MGFTLLIDKTELSLHLNDKKWAVVDCRFSLDDVERGRRDYLKAHIPGAVYAHLDEDLSGKKIPGKTGRHPLPEMTSLAVTLSAWGIDADTQVVVYDDATGTMAARLWWLLQWLGHSNVAVLDGGWMAWIRSGQTARSGRESRPPAHFEPNEISGAYVTTAQIQELRNDPRYVILDARSGPRFRGEVEPIDPVAGHIPGAISVPCEENVTPEGKFHPPEILRRRFENLMKAISPENVICYCGSGVTAAHTILAIALAGLGRPRLYAGSWSEWITDAARPIATGTS